MTLGTTARLSMSTLSSFWVLLFLGRKFNYLEKCFAGFCRFSGEQQGQIALKREVNETERDLDSSLDLMYHKIFAFNFHFSALSNLFSQSNEWRQRAKMENGIMKKLNKRTCILQFIKFNGKFCLIDFHRRKWGYAKLGWGNE